MMEIPILLAGIAIFSVTSAMFVILKQRNDEIATINLIVNFATIASYILMASGIGTISATNGELIYWTRWAFYAGSCSFLMIEISKILKKSRKKMMEIIVFNVLVMATGLLASITTGLAKWLFFIYSSVAYLYIIFQLMKGSRNRFITSFVLVFWSGFPVVWVLSPAGFMVIDALWTAISYLVLDLITKVYFGFYTTLKQKTG